MRRLEKISLFQLAGGNLKVYEISLLGCNQYLKKEVEGKEEEEMRGEKNAFCVTRTVDPLSLKLSTLVFPLFWGPPFAFGEA
jgi:hypothetical protein